MKYSIRVFHFARVISIVLIQTIGSEAGMDSNDTLKLPRAGGADPDSGQPGDLFVTINVS